MLKNIANDLEYKKDTKDKWGRCKESIAAREK